MNIHLFDFQVIFFHTLIIEEIPTFPTKRVGLAFSGVANGINRRVSARIHLFNVVNLIARFAKQS